METEATTDPGQPSSGTKIIDGNEDQPTAAKLEHHEEIDPPRQPKLLDTTMDTLPSEDDDSDANSNNNKETGHQDNEVMDDEKTPGLLLPTVDPEEGEGENAEEDAKDQLHAGENSGEGDKEGVVAEKIKADDDTITSLSAAEPSNVQDQVNSENENTNNCSDEPLATKEGQVQKVYEQPSESVVGNPEFHNHESTSPNDPPSVPAHDPVAEVQDEETNENMDASHDEQSTVVVAPVQQVQSQFVDKNGNAAKEEASPDFSESTQNPVEEVSGVTPASHEQPTTTDESVQKVEDEAEKDAAGSEIPPTEALVDEVTKLEEDDNNNDKNVKKDRPPQLTVVEPVDVKGRSDTGGTESGEEKVSAETPKEAPAPANVSKEACFSKGQPSPAESTTSTPCPVSTMRKCYPNVQFHKMVGSLSLSPEGLQFVFSDNQDRPGIARFPPMKIPWIAISKHQLAPNAVLQFVLITGKTTEFKLDSMETLEQVEMDINALWPGSQNQQGSKSDNVILSNQPKQSDNVNTDIRTGEEQKSTTVIVSEAENKVAQMLPALSVTDDTGALSGNPLLDIKEKTSENVANDENQSNGDGQANDQNALSDVGNKAREGYTEKAPEIMVALSGVTPKPCDGLSDGGGTETEEVGPEPPTEDSAVAAEVDEIANSNSKASAQPPIVESVGVTEPVVEVTHHQDEATSDSPTVESVDVPEQLDEGENNHNKASPQPPTVEQLGVTEPGVEDAHDKDEAHTDPPTENSVQVNACPNMGSTEKREVCTKPPLVESGEVMAQVEESGNNIGAAISEALSVELVKSTDQDDDAGATEKVSAEAPTVEPVDVKDQSIEGCTEKAQVSSEPLPVESKEASKESFAVDADTDEVGPDKSCEEVNSMAPSVEAMTKASPMEAEAQPGEAGNDRVDRNAESSIAEPSIAEPSEVKDRVAGDNGSSDTSTEPPQPTQLAGFVSEVGKEDCSNIPLAAEGAEFGDQVGEGVEKESDINSKPPRTTEQTNVRDQDADDAGPDLLLAAEPAGVNDEVVDNEGSSSEDNNERHGDPVPPDPSAATKQVEILDQDESSGDEYESCEEDNEKVVGKPVSAATIKEDEVKDEDDSSGSEYSSSEEEEEEVEKQKDESDSSSESESSSEEDESLSTSSYSSEGNLIYDALRDPELQAKNIVLAVLVLTHGARCQARGRCPFPNCSEARSMVRHVTRCQAVNNECGMTYCSNSKFVLRFAPLIQQAVLVQARQKAASDPYIKRMRAAAAAAAAGGRRNVSARRAAPRRAFSSTMPRITSNLLPSIPEGENEHATDSESESESENENLREPSVETASNKNLGSKDSGEGRSRKGGTNEGRAQSKGKWKIEYDDESDSDDDTDSFISATAWQGSKHGFFFGTKGGKLGYHRDDYQLNPPANSKTPEQAAADDNWKIEYSDDSESDNQEDEGTPATTIAKGMKKQASADVVWEIEYSDESDSEDGEGQTQSAPTANAKARKNRSIAENKREVEYSDESESEGPEEEEKQGEKPVKAPWHAVQYDSSSDNDDEEREENAPAVHEVDVVYSESESEEDGIGAPKGTGADLNNDEGSAFIPAKTWQGSRPGFFFGTKGALLGYHRDPVQVELEKSESETVAVGIDEQPLAVEVNAAETETSAIQFELPQHLDSPPKPNCSDTKLEQEDDKQVQNDSHTQLEISLVADTTSRPSVDASKADHDDKSNASSGVGGYITAESELSSEGDYSSDEDDYIAPAPAPFPMPFPVTDTAADDLRSKQQTLDTKENASENLSGDAKQLNEGGQAMELTQDKTELVDSGSKASDGYKEKEPGAVKDSTDVTPTQCDAMNKSNSQPSPVELTRSTPRRNSAMQKFYPNVRFHKMVGSLSLSCEGIQFIFSDNQDRQGIDRFPPMKIPWIAVSKHQLAPHAVLQLVLITGKTTEFKLDSTETLQEVEMDINSLWPGSQNKQGSKKDDVMQLNKPKQADNANTEIRTGEEQISDAENEGMRTLSALPTSDGPETLIGNPDVAGMVSPGGKAADSLSKASIYEPVHFKDHAGSLTVTDSKVVFKSTESDKPFTRTVSYKSIAKNQASPPKVAKALLKLVSTEGKIMTLEVENRKVLGKLQTEITGRRKAHDAKTAVVKKGWNSVGGPKQDDSSKISHSYDEVLFKDTTGSIHLSQDYFSFVPAIEGKSRRKLPWKDISKHQANPKTQSKALLRLFIGEGKSLIFELKSRDELTQVRKDISSIMGDGKPSSKAEDSTSAPPVPVPTDDLQTAEGPAEAPEHPSLSSANTPDTPLPITPELAAAADDAVSSPTVTEEIQTDVGQ